MGGALAGHGVAGGRDDLPGQGGVGGHAAAAADRGAGRDRQGAPGERPEPDDALHARREVRPGRQAQAARGAFRDPAGGQEALRRDPQRPARARGRPQGQAAGGGHNTAGRRAGAAGGRAGRWPGDVAERAALHAGRGACVRAAAADARARGAAAAPHLRSRRAGRPAPGVPRGPGADGQGLADLQVHQAPAAGGHIRASAYRGPVGGPIAWHASQTLAAAGTQAGHEASAGHQAAAARDASDLPGQASPEEPRRL
mmetsp:Transcript_118227/g.381612  ORF Transcript_118227/g.381612 Transcript_118227/m.381612 type:complete len:256 (+) Transcript_118227:689-1456(+)